MIRSYWEGIKDADNYHGSFNEAALVCLGEAPSAAAPSLSQVDPARCHLRAIAILANQQAFLRNLQTITAPAQFASDDVVFRRQVPLAIAAATKLVSISAGNDKQAVVDAADAYVATMKPSVLSALDDVDPSTVHD